MLSIKPTMSLLLLAALIGNLRGADLITGLGSPPQNILTQQGITGIPTFGENLLPRNDDGFSALIDITSVFPGGIRFGGVVWNGLYVSNNGCLTFGAGSSTFTPSQIQATATVPRIAAFFADVDTRGTISTVTLGGTSRGTNMVYWDLDPVAGIFTATWDDVGYYSNHRDRLCAFQIRLIRTGNSGDFIIEYRYEHMNWVTGDASGGSNGLGGTVARAGYTAANGTDFFELPQSGDQTQMLALETLSNQSPAVPGVFQFAILRPFPTITPADGVRTNDSPIPFTLRWNVPISGFTLSDVTVTGGTYVPDSWVEVEAGREYTFNVTPSADGPVRVAIAEDAVSSTGSGNTNADISHTVISDRTPPTMTITPNGTTVYNPTVAFTATVSEALMGFSATDIVSTNGPVTNFAANGLNYQFDVQTTVDGNLTVTAPLASFTDLAGNTLVADATATVTVETLGPTTVIALSPAGPISGNTITATITFQRAVTGFTVGDLQVTNGSIVDASFAGGPSVYTVQVTPSGHGLVTIQVPTGAAVDINGLSSLPGGASIFNDAIAPTVVISMPPAPLAGDAVAYLDFSEPVTGVTVSASGSGTAGGATAQTGSSTRFSVPLTATSTGTLTLTVTAANDLAGNPLAAPVDGSVATNIDLAELVITTTAGNRTALATIPITFTFPAAATDFIDTDVVVVNGTRGALTDAGGGVYTMPVTVSADGPVTISVASGACHVGGLANGASQLIVMSDRRLAPPTVTLNPQPGTPGSRMTVTLTFTEPVSGVALGDFAVSGGTPSALNSSASNLVHSFTVACDPRPSTSATLTIAAGSYQDGLGNPNEAMVVSLFDVNAASALAVEDNPCGFGVAFSVLLLVILLLPMTSGQRRRF